MIKLEITLNFNTKANDVKNEQIVYKINNSITTEGSHISEIPDYENKEILKPIA